MSGVINLAIMTWYCTVLQGLRGKQDGLEKSGANHCTKKTAQVGDVRIGPSTVFWSVTGQPVFSSRAQPPFELRVSGKCPAQSSYNGGAGYLDGLFPPSDDQSVRTSDGRAFPYYLR